MGNTISRDDGWRMPHWLWERMLPVPAFHAPGCHRSRVPDRDAIDAILLVLRTGCSGTRSTPPACAPHPRRTGAFRSGSRRRCLLRSGASASGSTSLGSVRKAGRSGGREDRVCPQRYSVRFRPEDALPVASVQ